MNERTHKKRAQRWRKKLQNGKFVGVLDDLAAFTGIDKDRLCGLIDESGPKTRAEYKFVKPKGVLEVELFYRTCREYLFLNSAREVWPTILKAWPNGPPVKMQPVLDFAGGCGNDTMWLANAGAGVVYHEISAVQREFVAFRLRRHGLRTRVRVARMYADGVYSSLGGLDDGSCGSALLRDVLEHVPNYSSLLEQLIRKLRVGALVMIYAPWNTDERYSPLHHEEDPPLVDVMSGMGFKQVDERVWRFRG